MLSEKYADNEEIWLASVGEALQERRLSLKMSQQELANLAGVHRTYISDVERGARNLTVATIMKIADALQINASKLFKKAEEFEKRSKG